jgi:hypothetical protein
VADFGWTKNQVKYLISMNLKNIYIHVYIKFWFGGCSPALPTLGCASAQHGQFSVFQMVMDKTVCTTQRNVQLSSDASQPKESVLSAKGICATRLSSVAKVLWCPPSCLTSVSALPSKTPLHSYNPQPIPWHKTCSVLLHHWRRISAGVTLFPRKNPNIPLTLTFERVCWRRAIYKTIVRRQDKLVLTSHGCMTTKTTYICLLRGDVHSQIMMLHVKSPAITPSPSHFSLGARQQMI